jgi:hypothetical protein
VFVPRTSSTPVATWFWQMEGRSAERVILGVRPSEFILSEFQSPSRRIFIGSHSLPPLWSPNRSFTKSVHQIRSFLGLAGYYRRFIPDFSRIAKPMTELLKKGVKFVWSDACEKAFHTLRQHLTSAPVLVQTDNSKPFEVFYDASGTGLGCVLMQ